MIEDEEDESGEELGSTTGSKSEEEEEEICLESPQRGRPFSQDKPADKCVCSLFQEESYLAFASDTPGL